MQTATHTHNTLDPIEREIISSKDKDSQKRKKEENTPFHIQFTVFSFYCP